LPGKPALGIPAIVGELNGVGFSVSATSVRKVLLEEGVGPAPERDFARPLDHARTATLPSPVSRERSNRKWRNLLQMRRFRMERTGIEPVTFGLQSRRSPS
jgi:hypothetical protein